MVLPLPAAAKRGGQGGGSSGQGEGSGGRKAGAAGAGAADAAGAGEAAGGGEGGGEAAEEEGEARPSLELQFTCIPAQGLLAVTAPKQPATLLLHLLGEDGGTTMPPPRPTDAMLPSAAQQKETLLALLPGQPFLWVQALGVATDTTGAKRALDTTTASNANERSAEQMLRFGAVVV